MSDCMFINANFRVNQTFESYAEIMNLDMTITDKSYFKAFFDKIGSVYGKEIINLFHEKYKFIRIWTTGEESGDIKLNFCFVNEYGDINYLEDMTEVDEDKFCEAAEDIVKEIIDSYEGFFEASMTSTGSEDDEDGVCIEFSVENNFGFDSKYGYVNIKKALFENIG